MLLAAALQALALVQSPSAAPAWMRLALCWCRQREVYTLVARAAACCCRPLQAQLRRAVSGWRLVDRSACRLALAAAEQLAMSRLWQAMQWLALLVVERISALALAHQEVL